MLVIDGNIEAVYIFRKTCTFIEKDKEIADYFQIKVIPGLLVIRERAGIFAHDDGEVSAKAFDEIITWAREYDMSTVKDYYKREGSGQIN